jgi:hypothetical protein
MAVQFGHGVASGEGRSRVAARWSERCALLASSPGSAYLPGQRRVVQFGGADPVAFSNFADTWDYSRSLVIGVGCAGSNGTPTLRASAGPRLGQNYVQTVDNLNASVPVAVLVLSLTQLAPTPLAGIGMPGCTAYIAPDLLVTVGAAAGSASSTLGIPNTVGLTGLSLFAQVLSLDPVNAAGLTVSNALDGRIGS